MIYTVSMVNDNNNSELILSEDYPTTNEALEAVEVKARTGIIMTIIDGIPRHVVVSWKLK